MEVTVTVTGGLPSMEAIAKEAEATDVKREAAECWCIGGLWLLTSLLELELYNIKDI